MIRRRDDDAVDVLVVEDAAEVLDEPRLEGRHLLQPLVVDSLRRQVGVDVAQGFDLDAGQPREAALQRIALAANPDAGEDDPSFAPTILPLCAAAVWVLRSSGAPTSPTAAVPSLAPKSRREMVVIRGKYRPGRGAADWSLTLPPVRHRAWLVRAKQSLPPSPRRLCERATEIRFAVAPVAPQSPGAKLNVPSQPKSGPPRDDMPTLAWKCVNFPSRPRTCTGQFRSRTRGGNARRPCCCPVQASRYHVTVQCRKTGRGRMRPSRADWQAVETRGGERAEGSRLTAELGALFRDTKVSSPGKGGRRCHRRGDAHGWTRGQLASVGAPGGGQRAGA